MKNIIIIMSSTIDNNNNEIEDKLIKSICHFCNEEIIVEDIVEIFRCDYCQNECCNDCYVYCEYCKNNMCHHCEEKYHNCYFCCYCSDIIDENDTIRNFCKGCKFYKEFHCKEDIHKTCTECFIHLLLTKKLIPCDTCCINGNTYWRNDD